MQQASSKPDVAGQADRPAPDPQGQAALLLIESLLHGLIEKGVLSVAEAIDVASSASEVKEHIADEGLEPQEAARQSLKLIDRIVASLELERPSDAVPQKRSGTPPPTHRANATR